MNITAIANRLVGLRKIEILQGDCQLEVGNRRPATIALLNGWAHYSTDGRITQRVGALLNGWEAPFGRAFEDVHGRRHDSQLNESNSRDFQCRTLRIVIPIVVGFGQASAERFADARKARKIGSCDTRIQQTRPKSYSSENIKSDLYALAYIFLFPVL